MGGNNEAKRFQVIATLIAEVHNTTESFKLLKTLVLQTFWLLQMHCYTCLFVGKTTYMCAYINECTSYLSAR